MLAGLQTCSDRRRRRVWASNASKRRTPRLSNTGVDKLQDPCQDPTRLPESSNDFQKCAANDCFNTWATVLHNADRDPGRVTKHAVDSISILDRACSTAQFVAFLPD